MNILSVPYIFGGLSHFLPLYVLNHKLKVINSIKNSFLVNNTIQNFLKIQNTRFVPIDYNFNENIIEDGKTDNLNRAIKEMEEEAFNIIKPSIVIEDTSFLTPLISEKNNVPRISIQRTGLFRSIDSSLRNGRHTHSLQKGFFIDKAEFSSEYIQSSIFDISESSYLNRYKESKVKIIPGIPSIECLPDNINNRDSYFYSGPLIIMDKPSINLSKRIHEFLDVNKGKPVVFITTGTIDRTPIRKFIELFVKRNYAVITTCDHEINETYKQEVFYNRLLPLNYICGISNLVIHQCGSGMYHYPLMNRVASLTLGTQCYDREDIALRLQELGVSGHIPHPDDNEDYWNTFLKMLDKFERNELINYDMMEVLRNEITQTMNAFKMKEVIDYALA
jgi:hypothetical protein